MAKKLTEQANQNKDSVGLFFNIRKIIHNITRRVDEYGNTPLHRAETAAEIERLLSLGEDVNAKNDSGKTALHLAFKAEKMKALIKGGADIYAKNKYGFMPIHKIQFADQFKAYVEACKEAGIKIDFNAGDNKGRTFLHHLCEAYANKAEVLQTAKELGVGLDFNAKDKDGKTPVHYLAERGVYGISVLEAAKELGYKLDLNAKDNDGKTPLFYVNETNIYDWLVDNGADKNATDNDGDTLLHHFSKTEYGDALFYKIINEGANVNAANKYNLPPLSMVVSTEKAKMLVVAGAKTTPEVLDKLPDSIGIDGFDWKGRLYTAGYSFRKKELLDFIEERNNKEQLKKIKNEAQKRVRSKLKYKEGTNGPAIADRIAEGKINGDITETVTPKKGKELAKQIKKEFALSKQAKSID